MTGDKAWDGKYIIAEYLIQRAMEQGAFDNLPGAGKPLPDLDETYDKLWWLRKLIQREQIRFPSPLAGLRGNAHE